jgi:D-cysteine desulfhydrase
VLGAARHHVAETVHAMAVCDDVAYFDGVINSIISDAKQRFGLEHAAKLVIHDRWKGPGYALASDDQRRFIVAVAKKTGLVVDPVYTGKALYALSELDPKPTRVLFLHTGGLPGLLAQADAFAGEI